MTNSPSAWSPPKCRFCGRRSTPPTLHPQFLGTTITRWRDSGETVQVMIAHEVADAIPYEKNPMRLSATVRETLRRRLDLPDKTLDFEILIELRERGGTDYIVIPINGVYATARMLTFVTHRPGGFTDKQLANLARLGQRLSIIANRHNQWWVTRNLLCAYHAAPDGEILKFVGDGLLAIFPIAESDAVMAVAKAAVGAAREDYDSVIEVGRAALRANSNLRLINA